VKSLDPWRLIVTDPAGEVIVPAPSYGHPFYREIPSWIHYGGGNGTTRQLFDGVFVGAAPRSPGADMNTEQQRRGLVAEVAPVIAPATGGITFRNELDAKQVLHVEVCVDGRCYRTSMDIAPAIALIMEKLARWHDGEHARMDRDPRTLEKLARWHAGEHARMARDPQTAVVGAVVGAVDAAVGEAVDLLVGALVDRHVATVCGSWLGDIGHAVSSAASGIAGGVVSTFKKLRGPIASAAAIAAAAGASAIPGVGLLAAPLAGKLAHDLVSAASGDKAAKKRVALANQQAQTDPTVAVALDQAQKAVATSTAAHHVQHTAKRAARGEPDAQQQIVQVATDAETGDPVAKAVADMVANAMHSEWGAKLWEKVIGPGHGPAPVDVSGWLEIVGACPTLGGW
jgi:hypothetical protein